MGIYVVFRANGGAQGHDFAARYLALGWVVGVRVTVLSLILLLLILAAIFLMAFAGIEQSDSWMAPLAVMFTLGVSVCYYWRLAAHISDVSRAPAPDAAGWA